MKLYKLTDSNGQTRGNTQWGPGVTHEAKGSPEQSLCSDGWIHAYTDPLLAVFLNPIHANFDNPKLFEAEGEIGKTDRGLKVGVRSLTTTVEIPLSVLTLNQKIAFGILCALKVESSPNFVRWAQNWLTGKDRAAWAARAAAEAARAEARAAAWEARAVWAAEAARAAAEAAEAAAEAARAAARAEARAAAWAARAAAWAARAAAEAARAEARAARAAAWAAEAADLDLPSLAKKAMEYR